MIPGAEQIVACPHCKGLAKYMTLVSGNTFGARVWTDGKQIAPMLPRPPAVVRCQQCRRCYWLADAARVGTLQPWSGEGAQVDPAWLAAQEVREPEEEEYYSALEAGLAADPQQEKSLRTLAWWRRNDAFRLAPDERAEATPTAVGRYRQNLEALANLLAEGDANEAIMRAEVLRELGQFESARQVLSRVSSSEHAIVVRQLRSLCDAEDICVRELRFGT